MEKTRIIALLFDTILLGAVLLSACISSEVVEKGGAELWGENCLRCHNSPSPSSFSDEQWEVVGMHMKMRANSTDEETRKIIEFLQSANE